MHRTSAMVSWGLICRTVTAILLSLTFLVLLAALAIFAMFTGNSDLLDKILRIVTYGIVFSCTWASGYSLLRRRQEKSETVTISEICAKVLDSGNVSKE
jgi:O-antigen/teichoic acid export membrane protein